MLKNSIIFSFPSTSVLNGAFSACLDSSVETQPKFSILLVFAIEFAYAIARCNSKWFQEVICKEIELLRVTALQSLTSTRW